MLVMPLSGKWTVRQGGTQPRLRTAIAATVPGCIHTDLIAAGKIEDPFYRDNELAAQWVGHADWNYGRAFNVDAAFLKHERILLRCEGLDTFATVFINGRRAGRADNQYRTWEFDVKNLLKAGRNDIEVRFESVIPYMRAMGKKRKMKSFQHAPWEETEREYVRKSPCNFGWDWGPALPTMGIWRAIELIAFDEARIADVHILQAHEGGRVDLTVRVAAEGAGKAFLSHAGRDAGAPSGAPSTRVWVVFNGKVVAKGEATLRNGKASVALGMEKPHLWWPNGMGAQPLYDVAVELVGPSGELLDIQNRRIGLRTLRLDRHKDQWGETFQFVANGVPFFAKGANWVPADQFPTRVTPERYRYLLKCCADANMNMLRVWGGGIYEDDIFYDLCDEMGLTIWQEFMFSCGSYPSDDAFCENVRIEAEQNLRRMRHHPCIAMYCGNNELEMLRNVEFDKPIENAMKWPEYEKIFDKLLPAAVRAADPERDYWPSSPLTPGRNRADSNDPTCGDAHLWEVWFGRKPFEWYRTCGHRFNSEFGFQSYPEPKCAREFMAPGDRNVTGYIMDHHQRSGSGNGLIMTYMADWFQMPKDFESTLWLSQIQHGMAMKYAVEHWRRSMPRGMGTLYWQVNDTWPCVSWASIDYAGRWKALHYMARRFFAPLLVSAVEDEKTGRVEIHVTSDAMKAVSGKIEWRLMTTNGRVLAASERAIKIAPRKSSKVETLDLSDPLANYGKRDLVVWVGLRVAGELVSENFVTFCRPKHLDLAQPGLAAKVKAQKDGSFRVTLKSKAPALWAWLELDKVEARYSDNFIHVIPGIPVEITVRPEKPLTAAQFSKALRVRSLTDTFS